MEKRFFNAWRVSLIGVFVLAVVIYLPSLMGAAIWDDTGLISGEQFGGNSYAAALTHPFGNYFRPLTSASFVLDSSYARSIPFFYHQTNVLLHALTAVLVSILAFLITRKPLAGILAGAFFATQSLQVGATAWIGGRTDVLSAFFLAAFLVCLVQYVQGSKAPWLIASLVSFFLAALSKEQAIAIFPIIPISIFVFGSKKWKDVWRICIPFGAVLGVYLVLWYLRAPIPRGAENGLFETLTLAGRTAAFYGMGLFAPNHDSLVTFTLENYRGAGWIALGAALVAGYGVLVWLSWKRSRPLAWVAIAGLLVYVPISNFPTLPSMVVASYRFGEAGIAAACLTGIICAYLVDSKRYLLGVILAANFVGGAVVTWWGVHQWMTPIGFFSQVAETDPHFIVGVQFYSQFLDSKGQHEDAIRVSKQTLDWVFGTADWVELLETKKLGAVTPDVRARLKANIGIPNYQTVGNFIGSHASYLARASRMVEARKVAKEALVLAPKDPWVNYLYGQLILPVDRSQAIRYWEIALRLAPEYASCAVSLAHERLRDGRYKEAAVLLGNALRALDYSGNTWIDLADAKIGINDFKGASDALDHAEKAMFPPNKSEVDKRRQKLLNR